MKTGQASTDATVNTRFGFVVNASFGHPAFAARGQEAIREEIESLEALRFDSLWAGGHVAAHKPTPEALMQLAQLAALSRRARIGTSILLLPLYQPAILAKQIADLDHISQGRLAIGVGVGGEYPQEFRAAGVPINERGRRTDEIIPLLRRLWSGEELSHPGPFYPMENVRIQPAPRQKPGPPIIVAGRQEAAMRRAALLGDGWMPYFFSARRYAESVVRVKTLAQESDRPLGDFSWMQFLWVNVQDRVEDAREEAGAHLGWTYRQDFSAMIEHVAAVGTADDVARRVQEYVEAGARHIIFSLATTGDRLAMAQRIASDVIPRFNPGRVLQAGTAPPTP